MRPSRNGRALRIVVAALIARDGRLLVARRLAGKHLAGMWEFPGGVVEQNETAEQALARELAEELGVRAAVGEPVTFAWHRDHARELLLLFYRATVTAGEPCGREGQEVRWVTPGELAGLRTPPADAHLVRLLAAGTIDIGEYGES